MLTEKPIADKHIQTRATVMREVLPKADSFTLTESDVSDHIVNVFEGTASGGKTGYVVELLADGYADKISMLVGISADENVITGMRVLSQRETPGLGALAVKEDFYRKFDNKPAAPLKVVKVSPGENEIDAMSGATITTRAITDAVNEAINWYNGGGG
jgi:electron transport complex protein RnfG